MGRCCVDVTAQSGGLVLAGIEGKVLAGMGGQVLGGMEARREEMVLVRILLRVKVMRKKNIVQEVLASFLSGLQK